MRLGEAALDALARHLVQEHRREHHIEARVGEIERLRIHLLEVDCTALRLRARVAVAQAGCGDVDAVHLGLRVVVLPGAGVVADGAAEVEDPARLEVRVLAADEAGDRLADVVEVLAHQAEREHREAIVVERAGGVTSSVSYSPS